MVASTKSGSTNGAGCHTSRVRAFVYASTRTPTLAYTRVVATLAKCLDDHGPGFYITFSRTHHTQTEGKCGRYMEEKKTVCHLLRRVRFKRRHRAYRVQPSYVQKMQNGSCHVGALCHSATVPRVQTRIPFWKGVHARTPITARVFYDTRTVLPSLHTTQCSLSYTPHGSDNVICYKNRPARQFPNSSSYTGSPHGFKAVSMYSWLLCGSSLALSRSLFKVSFSG